METKVLTALLVRRLDMAMLPDQQYDVITQKLTLEPRYGIKVEVRAAEAVSEKGEGGQARADMQEKKEG